MLVIQEFLLSTQMSLDSGMNSHVHSEDVCVLRVSSANEQSI